MSTLKDFLTTAELNPQFDHGKVLADNGLSIDELYEASLECASVKEPMVLQWATAFVAGLEWVEARRQQGNKQAEADSETKHLESLPEAHDTGLLDPT